eukprot:4457442-Heterocapsa_arctica.AAC.1
MAQLHARPQLTISGGGRLAAQAAQIRQLHVFQGPRTTASTLDRGPSSGLHENIVGKVNENNVG